MEKIARKIDTNEPQLRKLITQKALEIFEDVGKVDFGNVIGNQESDFLQAAHAYATAIAAEVEDGKNADKTTAQTLVDGYLRSFNLLKEKASALPIRVGDTADVVTAISRFEDTMRENFNTKLADLAAYEAWQAQQQAPRSAIAPETIAASRDAANKPRGK